MSSPTRDLPSRGLLGKLLHLARSWWRSDRPRASPREGRLLRITPPCLVRVGDTIVELTSRTVGETAAGPYLIYRGRSPTGPCSIRVRPTGTRGVASAYGLGSGEERSLSDEDVEVLG